MARPKKQLEVPQGVNQEGAPEGAVRDEVKQNPTDLAMNTTRKRMPGAWKKVSHEEMARLESEGKLRGYDQATGEVLI